MPYITQERREELCLKDAGPLSEGDLNYLITTLIKSHVCTKGLNYSTVNEVVGVLECAKLELYRRLAAPYEDQKRYDNGDVYE